jgi:hypothetical protein
MMACEAPSIVTVFFDPARSAMNASTLVGMLLSRVPKICQDGIVFQPRHQSLHAVLAWSCQLLGEAERMALRRQCVFPARLWSWPKSAWRVV